MTLDEMRKQRDAYHVKFLDTHIMVGELLQITREGIERVEIATRFLQSIADLTSEADTKSRALAGIAKIQSLDSAQESK